jgi:hypothetical protein
MNKNDISTDDWTIKHISDGKFECYLSDGSIKEVGPNMRGIIRFTYFEDFTLPPDGWETTRLTLLIDYNSKIMPQLDSHLKRMERTKTIKQIKNNL